MRREPDRARELLREAIEGAGAARSSFHRMFFLRSLAFLEVGVGNRADAVALYLATLDASVHLGDESHFCMTADGFVNLLGALHLDVPAAVLSASLALSAAGGRRAVAGRDRRPGPAAPRRRRVRRVGRAGRLDDRVDLMAWLTGEIVDRLPEVVEHDPLGLL